MARSSGTVLIPAMGLSARFADRGFSGPKALLPMTVGGSRRSTIRRIVETVPEGWRVVAVVPTEYRRHFALEIGPAGDCIGLSGPTEGQSQTVLRALLTCDQNEPVAVHNCDVVFQREYVHEMLGFDDNVVAVHEHLSAAQNPIFSYVNELGRATEFAEKRAISEWAQSGLWRFRRAGDLELAIQKQLDLDERHNGELYLSGALRHIQGGLLTSPVHVTRILDLGTPEAVWRAGGVIG